MAQRRPPRPTDRIDEALGFVLFFVAVFLVVTVFCELTGRPALGWALTLLAGVVALVGLYRWRVAVVRRAVGAAGGPTEVRRDGATGERRGAGRDHAATGTGVRDV